MIDNRCLNRFSSNNDSSDDSEDNNNCIKNIAIDCNSINTGNIMIITFKIKKVDLFNFYLRTSHMSSLFISEMDGSDNIYLFDLKVRDRGVDGSRCDQSISNPWNTMARQINARFSLICNDSFNRENVLRSVLLCATIILIQWASHKKNTQ